MNNMELRDLLVGEVCLETQSLEDIEIGSDAYKTTVDGLTKIVDRAIELSKIEQDTSIKEAQIFEEKRKFEAQLAAEKQKHEAEMELKNKQFEAEMKKHKAEMKAEKQKHDEEMKLKTKQYKADRNEKIAKTILTGVSVGGGMYLMAWGVCMSIKFEETGTFTTTAGRAVVNMLFKNKFI